MTLPASGAISFNAINVELGQPGATSASLNQASYRTLSGVASGQISLSNFYGKSSRASIAYTFSSPVADASLNVASIGGYVAGVSDITVTVGSGVYLYATSTGSYGLNLSGGTTGDTITLVNNGYIMGQGGTGGNYQLTNGTPGGPALNLSWPTTINNTNGSAYIGGGGGGGTNGQGPGGGGGAGGGPGGSSGRTNFPSYGGGAGGGIGSAGSPGAASGGAGGGAGGGGGGRYDSPGSGKGAQPVTTFNGGGGGGRIFPGSGGAGAQPPYGGPGGSANGNGSSGYDSGGGGGWGASGGYAIQPGQSGGPTIGVPGGKAVNLNGYSVTWINGDTSRIYGSVS